MRRLVLYLILSGLLLSSGALKGQESSDSVSIILEKLYDRLVNNYNDLSRIHINDSIRVIIESYVKSDSVFNHRFDNLRYLGQITSSDSVLKIVTWNLVLESRPGRYYCYIIRKGNSGKENKVYSLSTGYKDKPVVKDTTYNESDWYGALYYDLRYCEAEGKPAWVMLGIDYGNPSVTRKIIEVLSFGPGDSLLFGRKWFTSADKVSFREVMEYAAHATMSLRFSSDKSIVFDHLVPFSPAQAGDRQFYGPDYSTDAYYFKDGVWTLSINIDARNKE
jgi:hypothetical protein